MVIQLPLKWQNKRRMALPLKFIDLKIEVVLLIRDPDNESDAHIYSQVWWFLHVDQWSINFRGYLSNEMAGLLAPDDTIISTSFQETGFEVGEPTAI
jgi:hypothetical protein